MFGEYGGVALQLCDNSEVDFDVISSAADTAAEVRLHAARAPAESAHPAGRLCVLPARIQRDDVHGSAPLFFQ